MAVCWFNTDQDNRYRCTYTFEDDAIIIMAEYDSFGEYPYVVENGFKRVSIGTISEDKRDILIVDYEEKISYLVKNAFVTGLQNRFGTYDGVSITSFKSYEFFSHRDTEVLINLSERPKCSALRIFSKDFISFLGADSVTQQSEDDKWVILLKRNTESIDFYIETTKIKSIKYNSNWDQTTNWKEGAIIIDIFPYVEIQFKRRQPYSDVYKFVYEFELYMQLYSQERFKVDNISLKVNDLYLGYKCSTRKFNNKSQKNTIDCDLPSFLKACYQNVDYAFTKKNWLRNIPYVIDVYYRNIEDNYLIYYKFIECYYKSKGFVKTFVSTAIVNNYQDGNYTENELLKISREIVCLRNHYIHSGYYIKNNSLKISKPKKDKRYINFNPYTININPQWVRLRTDMLNQICIDIIYREILGFNNYR